MGDALVKIKVLPTSPEVDFEELRGKIKTILEAKGGKNCGFEEEPIAFGLKALIVSFVWPEELEMDMRRAIG